MTVSLVPSHRSTARSGLWSAAFAAVLVLVAHPLHAQRVKPAPLSLEATQSNDLLPQVGIQTSHAAPNNFQAAPMPDADMSAPLPPTPKTAELSPALFQPRKQFRGDGYAPGSTAQGWQEQRLKPAPGVSLKVPLQ